MIILNFIGLFFKNDFTDGVERDRTKIENWRRDSMTYAMNPAQPWMVRDHPTFPGVILFDPHPGMAGTSFIYILANKEEFVNALGNAIDDFSGCTNLTIPPGADVEKRLPEDD